MTTYPSNSGIHPQISRPKGVDWFGTISFGDAGPNSWMLTESRTCAVISWYFFREKNLLGSSTAWNMLTLVHVAQVLSCSWWICPILAIAPTEADPYGVLFGELEAWLHLTYTLSFHAKHQHMSGQTLVMASNPTLAWLTICFHWRSNPGLNERFPCCLVFVHNIGPNSRICFPDWSAPRLQHVENKTQELFLNGGITLRPWTPPKKMSIKTATTSRS